MRDNDRAKVYGAETELGVILSRPRTMVELHGSTYLVPDERRFGQVADIQRFVDSVLDHIGCSRPITVRVRKGHTSAHYEPLNSVIAIPEGNGWALREHIVLHEVAHHLAPLGEKHGPVFRKELTNLFDKVLAPEAGMMLRFLYWERGLTIA